MERKGSFNILDRIRLLNVYALRTQTQSIPTVQEQMACNRCSRSISYVINSNSILEDNKLDGINYVVLITGGMVFRKITLMTKMCLWYNYNRSNNMYWYGLRDLFHVISINICANQSICKSSVKGSVLKEVKRNIRFDFLCCLARHCIENTFCVLLNDLSSVTIILNWRRQLQILYHRRLCTVHWIFIYCCYYNGLFALFQCRM